MARLADLLSVAEPTALGPHHKWHMHCHACGHRFLRQFRNQRGCGACGSRGGLVLDRPLPLGPALPHDAFGYSERERVQARLTRLREQRIGRKDFRTPEDPLWVRGAATSLDGPFAVVLDEDRWYEEATALVRVPTTLNWPHGRIRPQCRLTNEGKARGFWTGRRRWTTGGLWPD